MTKRKNNLLIKITLIIGIALSSCSKTYLNLSDFESINSVQDYWKKGAVIKGDTLIFGTYGEKVNALIISSGELLKMDEHRIDTLFLTKNKDVIVDLEYVYGSFHKTGVLSEEFEFILPSKYFLDKLIIRHRYNNLNVHSCYQIILKIRGRGKKGIKKFHIREFEEINSIHNIYLVGDKFAIFYFDPILNENLSGERSIGFLDFEKLIKKKKK